MRAAIKKLQPGPPGTPGAGVSGRTATRRAAAALLVVLAAGLVLTVPGAWAGSPVVGHAESGAAPAAGSTARPRVMVVIIDRIGLDDLMEVDTPNIGRLISSGSVALMNARVKYDAYGLGSYLVIGAGGRALGGLNVGLAVNSSERLKTAEGPFLEAGDIYRSRTGHSAPDGSVVNLYIEEMKKKSEYYLATSPPGLMGQALTESGKKVGLLGNADSLSPGRCVDPGYQVEAAESVAPAPDDLSVYSTVTFLHREASCVAMDGEGVVGIGDVSGDLTESSPDGTGLITDFGKLTGKAADLFPSLDVLVIDLGQTSRVDQQAEFYDDKNLDESRAESLEECDGALGELLDLVDLSRDLVIVCTPTPTQEMISDGDLLTPLIIAGPGFGAGNRLHSPTTRRTGLVSNFDLAPTVLEFFSIDVPAEMSGRPLTDREAGADLEGLVRFQDKAVAAYNSRKTLVRLYVISSLVILALFLLCFLIRKDLVSEHRFFWTLLLLAVLAGPLTYLLIPLFGNPYLYRSIPIAVVGSLLLALAALTLRGKEAEGVEVALPAARPLLVLSAATLILVLLDPLLGSPLMTFSAFGSDAVLGDRYYGIGNLYMGVAIGSALLFTCLALEVFKKTLDEPWKRYTLSVTVLGLTTLFLGFPRIGANVGGLITAAAAFSVAMVKLSGRRVGAKKAVALVVVLVLCVAGLLLADALLPGSASHAGRLVSRIEGEGISALASQIGRKLSASWSLSFASNWRLLLLLLVIGGLVLNWRSHLFKRVRKKFFFLNAGFAGMAVGLVAALLFNDSGIEPAAVISVFLFVPYFLLSIPLTGKRRDEMPGEP